MSVTSVLQNQAGVQQNPVVDKSEAITANLSLNLFVCGSFKRGRTDKPFKVTSSDFRSKLGYDPENLEYCAVQDMLIAGAPFVWIHRIAS